MEKVFTIILKNEMKYERLAKKTLTVFLRTGALHPGPFHADHYEKVRRFIWDNFAIILLL